MKISVHKYCSPYFVESEEDFARFCVYITNQHYRFPGGSPLRRADYEWTKGFYIVIVNSDLKIIACSEHNSNIKEPLNKIPFK